MSFIQYQENNKLFFRIGLDVAVKQKIKRTKGHENPVKFSRVKEHYLFPSTDNPGLHTYLVHQLLFSA